MGRAGTALRHVLKTYGITQNRLAVVMGIGRSNVHRWINGLADPVGDAILDIRNALETIDPAAAKAFTLLYWERRIIDEEE